MTKILIVEDDKNILKALVIRLRARGYQTATAQDAHTAVVVATAEEPDLVLLDISLPGGNGFEVAARLRETPLLHDVPTVFLTASRRPGLREKAAALGAAAFFEKPYDASDLLSRIEQLAGQGQLR
jgi:two-component system KDP operon response regulator KdpE